MITDEMVKQKVAQFPERFTEEGARKVLEHQEKNKAKYGEGIYDKYYDALARKDNEALKNLFHKPGKECPACKGTCLEYSTKPKAEE